MADPAHSRVSIAYDPGVRERPALFPDPDDVFAGLDRRAAERLAARLGTPVYLLSEAALRERARAVRDAALGCDARAEVAWSVKTLPLAGVLRTLREEGFGTEVVSDLEYAMVRRLGVHPAEVVLNGPVRSDAVLAEALGDGAAVNLDHRGEIERVGRLAAEAGATFRVGLRVEFDPARRFGFRAARGEVREALDVLARTPGVELGGLHTHGGARVHTLAQFAEMAERLAELARGIDQPLAWIDVGGGILDTLVRWEEPERRSPWADVDAWCKVVLGPLRGLAPRLIVEPGRSVSEAAVALLTRVQGMRSDAEGRQAAVLDGGLNAVRTADTRRHPVRSLTRDGAAGPLEPTALYGPLCMNRDILARDAMLPPLSRGDFVLVEGVGAYSIPWAISFSQPLPGVALWRGGDDAAWLRRPQTLDDLLGMEELGE